jgi:site-specific DNA recombinase
MPPARRANRNAPNPVGAFDLRAYRHPKAYVRVSTDEQAEEGTSIDLQIKQITTYASAYGFSLNDNDIYVDDGWSGKDLDRPAMRQLCDDARKGEVDCVLVTKLDRFSRNLRDTVNLCLGEWQDEAPEGRRVILKSISEPFDTQTDFGRMVFGLLAMFAEFERRRIADRTWSGKAARAEEGRNAGHRPPYGYRLIQATDGKGGFFDIVPEEASIIQRIVELYLRGFGDGYIAHRLNEEGYRFRRDGLWQTQHVTRILTNPIIAGIYSYGRKTTDADGSCHRLPRDQWIVSQSTTAVPSIIDPEVFDSVQRIRSTRWTGGRREAGCYLLSGLVRCGRCGSACSVKLSGPGGKYRYFRCLRRIASGRIACTQPLVRADKLDEQVLGAIRCVLLESRDTLVSRVRDSVNLRVSGLEQSLKEIEAEETRMADLRRKYFEWLEGGLMRPEVVQGRLEELDRNIVHLASRRQSVNEQLASQRGQEITTAAYEHVLNSFSEAWDTLTPQERKRLVSTLVDNVEIDGFDVKITWSHDLYEVEFIASMDHRNAAGQVRTHSEWTSQQL